MRVATVRVDEKPVPAVSTDGESWFTVDRKKWPGIRSSKCLIEQWDGFDAAALFDSNLGDQPEFICPLLACEKIICVGKNYVDHAKEMGGEAPELPVIFSKFSSSLIGPNESIVLPEISHKVDYEAELVVVVGKRGFKISPELARNHVFGYTVGNDISARDWQKGRPGGQWLLGKTFDTFAPIGPFIVTSDEIEDPQDLNIVLKLNGHVMQQSNTSQMIFSIDELISHVSKFVTLKPGDLIFTGTPAGVGAGRVPEIYLKDGDEVSVEISSIGQLFNRVVRN